MLFQNYLVKGEMMKKKRRWTLGRGIEEGSEIWPEISLVSDGARTRSAS
jgi:hypothetical protein